MASFIISGEDLSIIPRKNTLEEIGGLPCLCYRPGGVEDHSYVDHAGNTFNILQSAFVRLAYQEVVNWYDSANNFNGEAVGGGENIVTKVDDDTWAPITVFNDGCDHRSLPGSPLENQMGQEYYWQAQFTHNGKQYNTPICVENLVFDIRGDKHSTCTQHPCGDCNPLGMWYWMSGITDDGGLVLYCNEPKNKGGLQLYLFPLYFCDDNV